MKMTTIYLTEKQMTYFSKHTELSMSGTIRKLLDEYIKEHERFK